MWLKRLRQALLRIPLEETTFATRGFVAGSAETQHHLETIGATFLHGYHLALAEDSPTVIARQLNRLDPELAGFAFEGAGMGLALSDLFAPWQHRFQVFLDGPGQAHTYMIHVGLGWMYARLKRTLSRPPAALSPLLGWLALDGYGFHEGYFHPVATIDRQQKPTRLTGYARRAFDQGVGRSLWFVKGAQPALIADAIDAFAPDRQADLWAGVGLACAYAGGIRLAEIDRLLLLAGQAHRPHLGQGAAFAAQARRRAGYLAAHTQLACEILCGVTAYQAADITDQALIDLPADADEPAYEIWRQRIRRQLAAAQPALSIA